MQSTVYFVQDGKVYTSYLRRTVTEDMLCYMYGERLTKLVKALGMSGIVEYREQSEMFPRKGYWLFVNQPKFLASDEKEASKTLRQLAKEQNTISK